MYEDILDIENRCGEFPNLVVSSYVQYKKLQNLLEDKKNFELQPRYGSEKMKAAANWSEIAIMGPGGLIPIIYERFVESDRLYYLNDEFIEICHRPDFGWFDDDGVVFLRKDDDDAYEARYGGYLEIYTAPTFQGYRHTLAT
jgi:hypothetical protein